ncbi:FUSC family protein [Streptomyces sp. NPDC058171]
MSEPPRATPVLPALAWHGGAAVSGVLYALPGGLVAAFDDPERGLALTLGGLPAVALVLPATRRHRALIVLVGCAAGVSVVLGSLLVHRDWLAVTGVFVLAVGAALLAARRAGGVLAMALCVPLLGVGFSYPEVSGALAVGALIAAGSAYAWLVSLVWPERPLPGRHPSLPLGRDEALGYGLRLGAAGAAATVVGLALAPTHPGWPVVAALMVMRPRPEMVRRRAVGRTVSVLVGGVLALAVLRTSPPDGVYGALCLLTLGCAGGVQGSRWYVLGGFTTFLVLLLLFQGDRGAAGGRFWERTVATLAGVSIAYLAGTVGRGDGAGRAGGPS